MNGATVLVLTLIGCEKNGQPTTKPALLSVQSKERGMDDLDELAHAIDSTPLDYDTRLDLQHLIAREGAQ